MDKSAYDEAARCLAELGHAKRLQAFRLLVQAGEDGLPVGEIQRRLDIPKSTLAHHIGQLVATGLVTQTREGRVQRWVGTISALPAAGLKSSGAMIRATLPLERVSTPSAPVWAISAWCPNSASRSPSVSAASGLSSMTSTRKAL